MAEEDILQEERDEDILEEQTDCILVQVANDHDLVKGLYRRFRSPGLSNGERQGLVSQMVRMLDAHVKAEEAVLCPALAKAIGEHARDHALDVDSSIKLIMNDLDAMRVGDEGFPEKMEQLMEVFFQHMNVEEHLMPALREAVGDESLMELGGRFKAAKEDFLARSLPPAPPVHA